MQGNCEEAVHHINLDQTGVGVFDGGRIIGFATVSRRIFGARQYICSWFVLRFQRNTDAGVSAGRSFPQPAKRRGSWVQISCTFRLIPQKNHRQHTGHLAVCLLRRQ